MEIDACSVRTCHNGGQCVTDEPGRAVCRCTSGFTGMTFDYACCLGRHLVLENLEIGIPVGNQKPEGKLG